MIEIANCKIYNGLIYFNVKLLLFFVDKLGYFFERLYSKYSKVNMMWYLSCKPSHPNRVTVCPPFAKSN